MSKEITAISIAGKKINIAGGSGSGAVSSVNGQTGAVIITASSIGALSDTTTALKNPYALSIDGTSYDGSSAVSVTSPVQSVNGETGTVELLPEDVHITHSTTIPTALSDGYLHFVYDNEEVDIPTKTSELENDSGYITIESIPSDVSDFNNDAGYITSDDIPSDYVPDSRTVNGKSLADDITLSAADVNAVPAEAITYGTTDIGTGAELTTGYIYLVYEE